MKLPDSVSFWVVSTWLNALTAFTFFNFIHITFFKSCVITSFLPVFGDWITLTFIETNFHLSKEASCWLWWTQTSLLSVFSSSSVVMLLCFIHKSHVGLSVTSSSVLLSSTVVKNCYEPNCYTDLFWLSPTHTVLLPQIHSEPFFFIAYRFMRRFLKIYVI